MFDLAVIGGGVNGCGIARDAAGRGLRVLLVEKNDLASGTSSASTKLVHGGLRYLEHHEFRLVRESLLEREVLLRMAPHIIWPMRFVLPHHRGLRPAWLIRLGLFLYDHLGGRELLPGCSSVDLRSGVVGEALKDEYRRGFEYSDCWVDDARLVVLNARDAAARGADIRTRTALTAAEPVDGQWRLSLEGTDRACTSQVTARAVVNAAGPWVGDVLHRRIGANYSASVRLVRGSHIIVPRLTAHDRAYIFQNSDGRIVFAIPYENDFTLIGTTDVDVGDDPAAAKISDEEIRYLCDAVGGYFRQAVSPDDIVHTYAGIRPLYDEGGGKTSAQQATRDYVLDYHGHPAPLLNVFGGKITTYRRLAEEALERFGPVFPDIGPAWTRGATLPGGGMPVGGHDTLAAELCAACDGLPPETAARWARTYGTDARDISGDAPNADALGEDFGAGLRAREVDFLMAREYARTAEDIVWRRTKLGLRLDAGEIGRLDDWMKEHDRQ